MKNIINYVKSNKASFTEEEFNPVDSLILSQLSYLEFAGLVPNIYELSDWVSLENLARQRGKEELYTNTRTSLNKKLLAAIEKSPRFKDVKLNYYINKLDYKIEKQFSAVSFKLPNGITYISYRGTDYTFVGWKEDFNMAFSNIIPSQKEAVNYLDKVGQLVLGELKVGGHSKGGNLAIYGAMKCEKSIRNRITDIFSHDSPGFREEVFTSKEYKKVRSLIRHFIPKSSLIGMLLNSSDNYLVVKSKRIGFMQHDPFSWEVEGGNFIYEDKIDSIAQVTNKTIKLWLDSVDDKDRALFIDALYKVIEATGAKTFSDLTIDIKGKAIAASSTIQNIDEDTKFFLLETIKDLFAIAMDNFREND